MKIGFYCESSADQAAMAVFIEGLIGAPPEPINIDLSAHGVESVFGALDGVFRGVHYNSDAEGFVVVVDCDDTEMHAPEHEKAGGAVERCRLCRARQIITQAQAQLKPVRGKAPLKVAIGLAVPTIEAWYLAGENHEVGEAAWRVGLAARKVPIDKRQLKRLVYGTDHPSIERETEIAIREARRIITNMTVIETAFPAGFGMMAKEIRSWVGK
jgi:hypothetical protein